MVETGVESAVFGSVGKCGAKGANMLGQEVIVDGWARFKRFDGGDVRGVGREGLIGQRCAVEEELDCRSFVVGVEEVVGWEIGDGSDRVGIEEVGASGRHGSDG